MKKFMVFIGLLIPVLGFAQPYSVNWYTVASGGGAVGGMNGGGGYTLSGTFGQPDAGGPVSAGGYTVTSGFWSLISLVQTPGLPSLSITRSGGKIIISWPATGSFILEQNHKLGAPAGWATSGYSVATSNGVNSVTITPPAGNWFFRLKQ